MVDLSNIATKWAMLFVSVFVVATLAVVFVPLLVDDSSNYGILEQYGSLDNATGNTYGTLIGAVPTILIIVFVIALILMAIGALKMNKHR